MQRGKQVETPEFHQDEMITDDPRITAPSHPLCDEFDEYGFRYGDLLDVTMPDGRRAGGADGHKG